VITCGYFESSRSTIRGQASLISKFNCIQGKLFMRLCTVISAPLLRFFTSRIYVVFIMLALSTTDSHIEWIHIKLTECCRIVQYIVIKYLFLKWCTFLQPSFIICEEFPLQSAVVMPVNRRQHIAKNEV
jgi:hypothetical protein